MYLAADGTPRWQSVTAELHSSTLPLAQWFRAVLPHRDTVFAAFRVTVKEPCIEPPVDVPGGTAGAAFDLLARCLLGSRVSSDSMSESIYALCPSRVWTEVAHDLLTLVGTNVAAREYEHTQGDCPDELIRGCWAVALFVELVRGVRFQRSALANLGDSPTVDAVLGLASVAAVDDLKAMQCVFSSLLQPIVDGRNGQLVAGPAFSSKLPGDADLIKGTTLFELKSMVHRRTRDGLPRYSLDSRTIYQVVAYSLLAQERFGIDEIVLFNARYAHTYTWRLDALLREMSGQASDAESLSAGLDLFLTNPLDPRVPLAARNAAASALAPRKPLCDTDVDFS